MGVTIAAILWPILKIAAIAGGVLLAARWAIGLIEDSAELEDVADAQDEHDQALSDLNRSRKKLHEDLDL